MVAEADESDRSFLKLFPSMAVITNIDHEHLENYGGFDDLQQAFVDFANKVPFYGGVVACLDDPNLAAIVPRMTRRVTTTALARRSANVTATEVELGPMSAKATVVKAGPKLGRIELSVPGLHNLQNALATVAVGLELGLPFERIASGLAEFAAPSAASRSAANPTAFSSSTTTAITRPKSRGAGGGAATESTRDRRLPAAPLHADCGAARRPSVPRWRRPITSCSPTSTRQARTRFPAPRWTRWRPPSAVMSWRLVDVALRLDEVIPIVKRIARSGDVVITLGAGSIGTLAERLVEALR